LPAARAAPEFKTLRRGTRHLVEDGANLDARTGSCEMALLLRATVLTSEEWQLVTVDNGVWIFQRPLRPNRGLAAKLSAQ